MWEALVKPPRGRISQRNFLMFFATFLVACFVYLASVSTPVYAANPATWDGDALQYQGNTYTSLDITSTAGLDKLPADAIAYQYISKTGGKQVAHIIYFPGGAAPKNSKEATYIQYTLNPPNSYTDPAKKTSINVEPSANNSEDSLNTSTTCDVDGVGWMVCTVSNWMAGGMDMLYNLVASFLNVTPLTNSNESLYAAWGFMRNIANLAFIIAFLVLIYYHLTGTVDAKLSIRVIVPRIVLVAVLVNVSYWIAAIAVDASNIAGYSIQQLFNTLREQLGAANSDVGGIGWKTITAFVLSGGAATYAGVAALGGATAFSGTSMSFLLIGALIPVLFAIFVAFAVLAVRQALITVFVIISPLAFIAYLLPNTEEWFTRWRKLFVAMLVMFPAFSFIFGAAQMAGIIIIQNAPDGILGIAIVILGLVVQSVPLFVTPFLIKLSTGVMGTIAGMVNNRGKGIFDRTRNWANDRSSFHKERAMASNPQNGPMQGMRRRYRNTGRHYGMRQHHRERMKAGYTSQAEALYERSARGQRAYREGRLGEDQKEYSKNFNEELFQRRVAGDVDPSTRSRGEQRLRYLANRQDQRYAEHQHMLHDSHAAGVRAGIIKDRIHDDGEQHVREAIANAAPGSYHARIRDHQEQSVISKGLAENALKEVNARGKQRLAETILADQAQFDRVVRTHEFEGRAAQVNELVEDAAKHNWQQVMLDDRTIYSRQLERQGNAKQLKELQDEWESILVEASTGRTDDYQRRHGPITQEVATSIQAIQTAEQGIEAEAFRKARGEHVKKVQLNKTLKADPTLLERAAGIDSEGSAKVLASLQKEASALHMENVEAAKSVFTNDKRYKNNVLVDVYRNGVLADGSKATMVQRHAALQRLLLETGNNYAVQDILDFSHEIGAQEMKDANGNTIVDASGDPVLFDIYGNQLSDEEIDSRRDTQQIINDAYAKNKVKVDWYSGTDRGLSESGRYIARDKNFNVRTDFAGSELSIAMEINKGKVDRIRAQGADIDLIDKQARALARRDVREELLEKEAAKQYADNLEAFLKDEHTGMRLEPRNRGSYHILLKELRAYVADQPINLAQMDNEYVDVVSGQTVRVLDLNKISNKPYSRRPAGPIQLS